jgi:hypothetical protein
MAETVQTPSREDLMQYDFEIGIIVYLVIFTDSLLFK